MPVPTPARLCVPVFALVAVTGALAEIPVEPGILDAVAAGRARVVVELNLGTDFTPEGRLDEDGAEAQRRRIASAQQAILSALAGDEARVVRRHASIPFLALEIGERALATLRAMPERVIRILNDDTAASQGPLQ